MKRQPQRLTKDTADKMVCVCVCGMWNSQFW